MTQELVKMSPKGQLVVPEEIRKEERFTPGDRFIALPIKGGVFFKKVKIPELQAEFDTLSKELTAHFKKRKVVSGDITGAIQWARKKSS